MVKNKFPGDSWEITARRSQASPYTNSVAQTITQPLAKLGDVFTT